MPHLQPGQIPPIMQAPGRLTATIAHQPAAGRSVKVVTPSCPLAFGDELVVVGSHQGWKPEAGTVLTWTEGDTWVGELSEPLTDPALEFKVRLALARGICGVGGCRDGYL